MSLLLDDAQVAINDVLLRLQEAADHYREVLEDTDADELATACQSATDICNNDIEALVAFIREQGQLPRQPDSEREAIELGLSKLGASIAPDEDRAHCEALLLREKKLCEAITEAQQHALPDTGTALLRKIVNNSQSRQRQLADDG